MTNNDAPFIDTSVNIIASWLTIYGYCCLTKLNLHQNYFIITVKIKIVGFFTSETKEIIKIMKQQITAYFSVLYTSASISHFFLIWASKWLFKTLYVGTKIRNRWNNNEDSSCTEGPIEITIIICDCLILRLYEINVGVFFNLFREWTCKQIFQT